MAIHSTEASLRCTTKRRGYPRRPKLVAVLVSFSADRLLRERIYNGNPQPDEAGRIRVDDWEMTSEVQELIGKRWAEVNTENLHELGDFEGYQSSFLRLFGFGLSGVDYTAESDPGVAVPSLAQ